MSAFKNRFIVAKTAFVWIVATELEINISGKSKKPFKKEILTHFLAKKKISILMYYILFNTRFKLEIQDVIAKIVLA